MGFLQSIGSALGAILDAAQTVKTCPKCGSHNIWDEEEPYGGTDDENIHFGVPVPTGKDWCRDCNHVFLFK